MVLVWPDNTDRPGTLIKLTLLALVTAIGVGCIHGRDWPQQEISVELIGQAIFPTGYRYDDVEVGGLSGIDYDPLRNRFVAISDDRAQRGPVRYFDLSIDLTDGTLDQGDVEFRGVTELLSPDGDAIRALTVDPESIRYTSSRDSLAWTSEGTATGAPFIRIMTTAGRHLAEFAPPEKYLLRPGPDADWGIRDNKGFESLTYTVDYRYIVTATENALFQDGPSATLNAGSPARVLFLHAQTGQRYAEYVYVTEPLAAAPIPANAFATNGLVELLALDNSVLLSLERSYSSGVGNAARLFLTTIADASDVSELESLSQSHFKPMRKTLLLDLKTLNLKLDNLEGMTFGPRLTDGSRTLILISDNNFNINGGQVTQFIALKLSTP